MMVFLFPSRTFGTPTGFHSQLSAHPVPTSHSFQCSAHIMPDLQIWEWQSNGACHINCCMLSCKNVNKCVYRCVQGPLLCNDKLEFIVIWTVTAVQTTPQLRKACKPVCCSWAGHCSGSTQRSKGPTLLIPKLSHSDTVFVQVRPPLVLINDLLAIWLSMLFLTTCQCVIIPGHYFVRQILFVTSRTVCVAGAAQRMPLFHFVVNRDPRYLFQCIPSNKSFFSHFIYFNKFLESFNLLYRS